MTTAEPKKLARVSAAKTRALLHAYRRVATGKATICIGMELTVENVAMEAAVSRATAYRCADLMEKFRPTPTAPEARAAEQQRRKNKRSTERELREMLLRALNRIVLLEERGRHKDAEIEKCRRRCPIQQSNVIPIRPGAPTTDQEG